MDTFLYYALNYSLTINWSFVRDLVRYAKRNDEPTGSQHHGKSLQDGALQYESEWVAVFSSISTLFVGGLVVVIAALARSY